MGGGDKAGVVGLLIQDGRERDLRALASVSGNKNVSLNAVKKLTGLTGYQRGSCSPLGGKKDYPVYIHREIMNHDQIVINAGGRGLMFLMSPADLVKAAGAVLADLARPNTAPIV